MTTPTTVTKMGIRWVCEAGVWVAQSHVAGIILYANADGSWSIDYWIGGANLATGKAESAEAAKIEASKAARAHYAKYPNG